MARVARGSQRSKSFAVAAHRRAALGSAPSAVRRRTDGQEEVHQGQVASSNGNIQWEPAFGIRHVQQRAQVNALRALCAVSL